jgi:hypothetical protein
MARVKSIVSNTKDPGIPLWTADNRWSRDHRPANEILGLRMSSQWEDSFASHVQLNSVNYIWPRSTTLEYSTLIDLDENYYQ